MTEKKETKIALNLSVERKDGEITNISIGGRNFNKDEKKLSLLHGIDHFMKGFYSIVDYDCEDLNKSYRNFKNEIK